MPEATGTVRATDSVVRALSAASKSLRLYPPSSPIPRQAVDAAAAQLDGLFADGLAEFTVAVTREDLPPTTGWCRAIRSPVPSSSRSCAPMAWPPWR